MSTFTADQIYALLEELGERLGRRGIRAEMYVVGGAAMALAYDAERLTRDIDAVFLPKSEVYNEALLMARERNDLDEGWLNDAVKSLVPPGRDEQARAILDSPFIHVAVASPEYMIALKVQSARVERDGGDLLHLCDLFGITTAEDALDVAERVLGTGRITPKSLFFVQELFSGRQGYVGRVSPPDTAAMPPGTDPVRCRAINKDGSRCTRKAQQNGRCWQHNQ